MPRHPIAPAAAASLVLLAAPALGQPPRVRQPIRIPDLPGYVTLKCDFHIHTVFSDGEVWPDVRPEEAWREGLDAIAITDHLEYLPHADDLPPRHNRSYEIARPRGGVLGVTVIAGAEVTRDMPPGHLNAIFLNDAEALAVPEWRDALAAAGRQAAFVFWNHPGWKPDLPDGVFRWYPEHDELLRGGLLHGIEVVNTREYYPEAHRLALEKGLTMLSNSDVHSPSNLDYRVRQGDHRPLTLVFARDAGPEAIREALFARRTAVYSGERLIGHEAYLRPIFERSVEVVTPTASVLEGWAYVRVHNDSDLIFRLSRRRLADAVVAPESIVLEPGRTSVLELEITAAQSDEPLAIALAYVVDNLEIAPGLGLDVALRFELPAR